MVIVAIALLLSAAIRADEPVITAESIELTMHRGFTYQISSSTNLTEWTDLGTYNLQLLQLPSVRFIRRHSGDQNFYRINRTGAGSFAPTLDEWNNLPRGERFGLPWNFASETQFFDGRVFGTYTYSKPAPNSAVIDLAYPNGRVITSNLIFTGPGRGYYSTTFYSNGSLVTTIRSSFGQE